MSRRADSAPLVTVVLPSRDRPVEVRRAARTVIAQTFTDWELVVVDDGSEPAADVIGLEAMDPRILVLRNETSQGVSEARNRGILEARGRWLAFLDDDDVWHPRKLAAQLAAAEEFGATFVYTSSAVVEADLASARVERALADGEFHRRMAYGNLVRAPSCVLADTDAVRSVGGFDRDLSVTADWDLWLRLRDRVTAAAVDEPLTGVVEHPGSMQLVLAEEIGDELDHLRMRHGPICRERGWVFASHDLERWRAQKRWAAKPTPARGLAYAWWVVRCNGIRGTARKLDEHRAWRAATPPDWLRDQLETPALQPAVASAHTTADVA